MRPGDRMLLGRTQVLSTSKSDSLRDGKRCHAAARRSNGRDKQDMLLLTVHHDSQMVLVDLHNFEAQVNAGLLTRPLVMFNMESSEVKIFGAVNSSPSRSLFNGKRTLR